MICKALYLILISSLVSSFGFPTQENSMDSSKLSPRRAYVAPNSIPSSLLSQYNFLKSGFTQLGKKWRSGMIEHRKVVKVYPNTTSFYNEETIVITSGFYDITGLSTITINEDHSFSTTETVTTSINVTLAGETALAVGASIYGATLSNERTAQASFSYGYSVSYSSTYTDSTGVSVTYVLANIPNIPSGASIASCVVADYFECSASIKEEEYWFWGTYTTHDWEDFTVRFFTFKYVTYYFSNGQRGVSTVRPY